MPRNILCAVALLWSIRHIANIVPSDIITGAIINNFDFIVYGISKVSLLRIPFLYFKG